MSDVMRGPQGEKGDRGAQGPRGESFLVGVAEEQVRRLIKAKSAPKWWAAVIAGIIAGMLIGGIVLGITVRKTMDEQVAQKQGAITSCISGNHARATNVLIWTEFLNLALNNPVQVQTRASLLSTIGLLNLPPAEVKAFKALIDASWTTGPANKALVEQLEAYIAMHEPQQNCLKLYSAG